MHKKQRRCVLIPPIVLGLAMAAGLLWLLAAPQAPVEADAPRGAPDPVDVDRKALTSPGTGSSTCEDGEQASGAKYRICTPTVTWNGDLVLYAHGYVGPDEPVEIPEDQMSLPGTGTTIDQIVTDLGFAFATTSYYTNGLAVLPALSDLLDLVHIFTSTKGLPEHIYLAGVSEGGLITALSVEQYPDVYDGGLAMCGPYGDFQGQINHYGDLRVVFDYFFPDLMPGAPFSVPSSLKDDWRGGFFSTTIEPVITDLANITKVTQLLTVTGVSPYRYAPPTSTASISKLLWYNVFAVEDATAKLGGQPFDNHGRDYTGSSDDSALNAGVARFSADQAALDEIQAHYQTTGKLSAPLVTLHTTGDEGVPYWHATQYLSKTHTAGSEDLHAHVRVDRDGHCNFTPIEVLAAFSRLVTMVMERERVSLYLPVIVQGWP
jgi:pimeloyl-ACP methyl ester carboxylesterase